MKPIEVTEENFEALLVYDDLFLDYFNAFLQLPAFPQPLYYNRLTGTFQEVEDEAQKANSALASIEEGIPGSRLRFPNAAPYAPGEEERERIVDWAKKERLPLFLRTKLFLEYKLCKLLLRPLDERRPASRQNSSRGLRGYSRQTTSYTSTSASLAPSQGASTYDNEPSEYGYWLDEQERMAMFRYLRPGSRCISLPPMLDVGPSSPMWTNEAHSDMPTAAAGAAMAAGSGHNVSPAVKPSSKSASGRRSLSKAVPALRPDRSPAENGWMPDAMSEFADDVQQRLSINGDAESSCKYGGGAAASRKSALRSPGTKRLSPKKRATIMVPSADEALCNPLAESSSTLQFSDRVPSPSDDYTVPPVVASGTYQTSLEQSLLAGDAEEEDEEDEEDVATASVIEYDDEEDERTESELREIEGRHRVTFQQLKESIIGSWMGMDAFKSFLSSTAGEDMMNFWLDCELYSDNVQAIHLGETATSATMTRLFRDIQDKYKFNLTADAKEQIKRAQGNTGLSESVFTRTQYDVLRRLRSYWVARFVLHKDRAVSMSPEKDERPQAAADMDSDPRSPQLGFLPSISLAKSLPVRPSSCVRLASTSRDWSRVAGGGRRMEEAVRPGRLVDPDALPYVPRPLSARFHVGLAGDREAGRPFQRHLEKQMDKKLLANLLFWQDVTDYGAAEDRDADRLLRMGHAWSILNKFIMDGGIWNIGIDPYERDAIHRRLLMTSDFVEASTFSRAKEHAVLMLQREWLVYLKEDLKEFLQCRSRPDDRISSKGSHRSSVKSVMNESDQSSREDDSDSEETESSDHDSSSTPSKTPKRKNRVQSRAVRARPRKRELSPASKKAAQLRKRKEQLAMQKKLLRQVRKARAEAQKKKKQPGVKFQAEGEKGAGGGGGGGDNAGKAKGKKEGQAGLAVPQIQTYQPPDVGGQAEEAREDATFKKMVKNKQLMSLFKNYMQEIEGKEHLSAFNMYFDIEAALRLPDAHAEKRYNLSRQISNTYFDPSSKKAVDLSHDILTRLSNDGDRPTVKTLEAAQKHAIPKLEQVFSNFWIIHRSNVYQFQAGHVDKTYLTSEEVQMVLVLTSKAHTESMDEQGGGGGGDSKFDLALRSGSTQSLVLTWKRRRRGKGPHSGQQMPTSQDKNEFQSFLLKSARGVPPPKMMYFHRYLMEYGDKDTMPLLEKDLIFYLEVQRFKESHHAYSDMFMLKRKVEVIVDCFIDSPVSNPGLQIDVLPEAASKLLKQTDNYLKDKGKDPHNPTLFDDAQYTVFKEMLPYWSSFTRRFREYQTKNPRLPSTKVERLTKQRLKKFIDMKEPRRDFKLPSVTVAPQNRTGGTGITFSISDGLQWKNYEYELSDGTVSPTQSRRASSIDSNLGPTFHRLRAATNRSAVSQDSTSTRASRGTARVGVTA